MQARDLDQFRGQVDGGDVGTGLRQCLAQQATTATDVEHARTAQWHAVGHVLQPHRVQRMQRLLRAVSVPPAVGQRGELVQLGLIEIGGSVGGSHEGVLAAPGFRRGYDGCARATGARWR
ncbi:hypothetical protein G6F35_014668 [Rhizopus arrhizus]|nr:hypothetical protein G6F35_014668 [Rhizopus arrhizus]